MTWPTIPSRLWLQVYQDTKASARVSSIIWDTRAEPDPCLDGVAARPKIEFHMRRLSEAEANRLGGANFSRYLRLSAWLDHDRGTDEAAADVVLSRIESGLNVLWGTSAAPGPFRDKLNLQWLDRREWNGRIFWAWATLPTDERLGFRQ